MMLLTSSGRYPRLASASASRGRSATVSSSAGADSAPCLPATAGAQACRCHLPRVTAPWLPLPASPRRNAGSSCRRQGRCTRDPRDHRRSTSGELPGGDNAAGNLRSIRSSATQSIVLCHFVPVRLRSEQGPLRYGMRKDLGHRIRTTEMAGVMGIHACRRCQFSRWRPSNEAGPAGRHPSRDRHDGERWRYRSATRSPAG